MAKDSPWGPSHPGLRIGIQITAYKKHIYIFTLHIYIFTYSQNKSLRYTVET